MLEKEYKYYQDHRVDLIKKFNNKFIVISSDQITGVYDSRDEALSDALKSYALGHFLIQKVSDKDEEQIQRFTSRVYF